LDILLSRFLLKNDLFTGTFMLREVFA